MPSGAGVRAGPFHSQSTEGWFMQVPGLKVVIPSNPYDAKGLLIASINDPNPVIFLEHKALYRSLKDLVPEDFYSVPLETANIVEAGERVTIVTYGLGVQWAKQVVKKHYQVGEIEIIDLRSLLPLDLATITNSVKKTGRLIVLTEPPSFCGPGAEIFAAITEDSFEFLDAPPLRVGSLFTPVPFAAELEDQYLANRILTQSIEKVYRY
jgi:2-oxoisovalerate dehydrogenase E1 component